MSVPEYFYLPIRVLRYDYVTLVLIVYIKTGKVLQPGRNREMLKKQGFPVKTGNVGVKKND